jgi:chromosome segregation ATPase
VDKAAESVKALAARVNAREAMANEPATDQTYRSALTRALARAHKAVARVSLSRDKWRARALEATDENAWADVADVTGNVTLGQLHESMRAEREAAAVTLNAVMSECVRLQEKVAGLEKCEPHTYVRAVEKERDEARIKCAAWDKENQALRAVAEGLKRECDEARRDLATALAAEQRRHEDLRASGKAREEAETLLREAQKQLVDVAAERNIATEHKKIFKAERDAAGKEVTRLAAKVADLEVLAATLTDERDRVARVLAVAEDDRARVGKRYNAEISRREKAEADARFDRERAEALEKQLAAANEERDNLKARLSLAGSDTLRGVKFELDRAVRLGTRPPSKMLADVQRILALIPGDA